MVASLCNHCEGAEAVLGAGGLRPLVSMLGTAAVGGVQERAAAERVQQKTAIALSRWVLFFRELFFFFLRGFFYFIN